MMVLCRARAKVRRRALTTNRNIRGAANFHMFFSCLGWLHGFSLLPQGQDVLLARSFSSLKDHVLFLTSKNFNVISTSLDTNAFPSVPGFRITRSKEIIACLPIRECVDIDAF